MNEGENILVTGAAGFIGSFICEELLQNTVKTKVIAYDVLSYCSSRKNLRSIRDHPRFTFVRGNICKIDQVEEVMSTHNITMVIHCAAESHVDNSFGNSLHFTETNVVGTHVMLECAKKRFEKGNLNRFLHVSTDEVYGTTDENHVHTEKSLLCPTNPYAASKAAAEQYVRSYAESYGLPTVITRSNNIYGPRQHPEKVLPRFVQRVLRGKVPKVDGNLNNERTFLHVKDVARAICLVLAKGVVNETYNIGCDQNTKIYELAEMVVRLANQEFGTEIKQQFEQSGKDRPFNDARYRLCWDAITQLGWKPEVDFTEGVREVIAWHAQDKNLRKHYWNDSNWLKLVISQ